MTVREIDTPHGPARAHVDAAADARGALVLGHGANGSFQAKDLVTAAQVAREHDLTVVLVEQPYLVAGRKSAAPAPQLDAAWTAVIEGLELGDAPLIAGGRSAGARVACRTAEATGAAGILCLAFPLHPPGKPEKTRLPELEAVTQPVLIVQGKRDPFGMPPAAPSREVVQVPGTHSLASGLGPLADALRDWLPRVLVS